MLSIENITKSYASPDGAVRVLTGVSASLSSGESAALMGESGSGKSTLLHLVGALDRPDSGRITLTVNDKRPSVEITALSEKARARLRRETVGIIFQQFNLIPSLTVRQNLVFQARLAGRYDEAWAHSLADRLGLSGMLDRFPEQLSGGQQQRLAIGRTFAARPHLVLADEPTGNLDEATSESVLDLALDLVRKTGTALLMATHSQRVADRTDRRFILDRGRIR